MGVVKNNKVNTLGNSITDKINKILAKSKKSKKYQKTVKSQKLNIQNNYCFKLQS